MRGASLMRACRIQLGHASSNSSEPLRTLNTDGLSSCRCIIQDGGLPATSSSRACSTSASSHHASASDLSLQPQGWLYRGFKGVGEGSKQQGAGATGERKKRWFNFWQREGPDGKIVPMATWEKIYWGVGVGGMGTWLLTRVNRTIHKDDDKAEAEAKAKLEEDRTTAIRAYIAGKSFLDEDCPFEGMTPKEIQALSRKVAGVVRSTEDPFEGMTPEEIDAYVEKHGMPS